MSKRTVSEIRAYCEAATKEPWWWDQTTECIATPAGYTAALGERDQKSDVPLRDSVVDGTFIANARTDLPRLLDAATALWERLRIHGLSVGLDWDTRALLTKTMWLEEDTNEQANG